MQIDHVEIAKLSLEPGDLLVVNVHGDIPFENVSRAVEAAMKRAGVQAPILIGPAGSVEFCVIRALKVAA